jgi:hypothetical protein
MFPDRAAVRPLANMVNQMADLLKVFHSGYGKLLSTIKADWREIKISRSEGSVPFPAGQCSDCCTLKIKMPCRDVIWQRYSFIKRKSPVRELRLPGICAGWCLNECSRLGITENFKI